LECETRVATRPNPARSVFVNCPLDVDYKPIFDAVVFAVFDCGFVARSALELIDGADVRVEKIARIIETSRYGIHDISRTELDAANGLPRFNMPFELGLFLGARRFGTKQQSRKRRLILDREPHRYQRFLSDIAGQDIAARRNSPREAITCVRDWLSSVSRLKTIPGTSHIWGRYESFRRDLPALARKLKLEPGEIRFNDLCDLISIWLSEFGGKG
jgi:hypothetical protein